jgi:hypothetical protein
MTSGCRWAGDDLILVARVTPRARRDELQEIREGVLRIRLQAPPVDGKANAQLIKFIAGELGVPASRIVLLAGETSRNKRLRVRGPLRIPDSWAQLADSLGD